MWVKKKEGGHVVNLDKVSYFFNFDYSQNEKFIYFVQTANDTGVILVFEDEIKRDTAYNKILDVLNNVSSGNQVIEV